MMMDACVALSDITGNALKEHDQRSGLTQNEMVLWHDHRDNGGCSDIVMM